MSTNTTIRHNFYLPYNPDTRQSTFTTCTTKNCTQLTCQRHPNNNPSPASEANLYIECLGYRVVETDTDERESSE